MCHISDVFVRFKDDEGGFLVDSPKDLLNFYNAAHMRTHGEVILEEAILFGRRRLETMIPYMEGSLAHEIKSALEIPLPRRVRIYESKYYISTYEKDATVHEKVLQLAKLNSNIMQCHHQHELDIITRWSKTFLLKFYYWKITTNSVTNKITTSNKFIGGGKIYRLNRGFHLLEIEL